MIIVRPISKKDIDIFVEFSFDATLGIRNLPRDKDTLQKKVKLSEASFAQDVQKPGKEEYLFVLEDLTTGRIGGTSGIFAMMNTFNNFVFRLETVRTKARHFSAAKEMQVLKLCEHNKKASEICSLYLQPTFRHSGQGRLLSLSRFLFIGAHRQRFEKKIIAEMRGYIDQRQISPFWDAIGRHFCNLSFVELMAQIDQENINIEEILPQFPIYVSLLPKSAQEVIGKTHEGTKPAMHMLLNEGFTFTQDVDVLEAGPTLEVNTDSVRTIKNSQLIKVELTDELLNDEGEYILSNESLDFRACYGQLKINIQKNIGIINHNVAEALRVKPNDLVRYVTLH